MGINNYSEPISVEIVKDVEPEEINEEVIDVEDSGDVTEN